MTINEAQEILGLKENASAVDIRLAYLQKCTYYHPDRGGDPWAFRKVREAYEILQAAKRNNDQTQTASTEAGPPPFESSPQAASNRAFSTYNGFFRGVLAWAFSGALLFAVICWWIVQDVPVLVGAGIGFLWGGLIRVFD